MDKRIQVRLGFDAKLGPLWNWLCGLSEGERRVQLMFLIQLGFEAREGVRTGPGRQARDFTSIAVGGNQQEKAVPEGSASESTEAAAQALGSWSNLVDMAAPPV